MKCLLAVIVALAIFPFTGNAQLKTTAPSPVHWQFSIQKVDETVYRFEAKATMDKGYHIWAQDAGGDGTLIPTSFTAEQLQNGGWSGDWKESAKPRSQTFEGVDGPVFFHEKTITFYRDFKGRHGDKIKGAVQYQSCNEQMCFPPAIENFVVLIP